MTIGAVLELLPLLSVPARCGIVWKILHVLTLIYRLYCYKQDHFYPLKLGTAGHLPVSCVLLSVSCWPQPLAGRNAIFWGCHCHYFVPVPFWGPTCCLCAAISSPSSSSGGFSVGESSTKLCQSQLYMCGVEFLLPLMKSQCQNLKQLFLLSHRQHCLFHPTKSCYSLIHFSLSLTAKSINYFSAKILEGFLPLPHFLKSLHTEWDTHKLFWDKNLIYLCFTVPGMATDWFGNLLFQL